MVSLNLMHASLTILLDLHCSHSLLLIHDLILHAVFLLDLEVLELLFLLILLLDYLGLLSLFPLRLEDGLLNFPLFISSLLVDRVVVLSDHALVLVSHLVVVNFLQEKSQRNFVRDSDTAPQRVR